MDTLLVKIFATALTFSQVATAPDRVKTEFDPIQDRQQVVSLLRAGCAQMRKAFDIEDLNVDDLKGERFAEVYEPDQRRVWVDLADIPVHVRKAFVAAEDKRFYQHKGIDERALIRAFIGNLAQSGRPQGGSTITQQTVKNLLVGEDVTYERKMREMILSARLEQTLSKDEILELYLNSTYLGRASWGVGMEI